MAKYLFRKPQPLDLTNSLLQRAFIEDTYSPPELIKKELVVNQGEQNLLLKRIAMMKSFVSDLPSTDPQYSMILAQIHMDKIELDELKIRERILLDQLRVV